MWEIDHAWRDPADHRPSLVNRRFRAVISLVITALFSASLTIHSAATEVSIRGEKFLIDNVVTNPNSQLEGLLPNSRMVQATFDDANPLTVGMWKYPNGLSYDPSRQTREFVAALPSYHAHGLAAVTINFQGGKPVASFAGATQPWDNSAFNPDGSLEPDYLARMDQVIRALDGQGMVAIVGYFYFGQDERLTDETAVRDAAANATQWILDQGYRNVLIEVANETDSPLYHHAILESGRVAELIRAVQTQSSNAGKRLNVGVSYSAGQIPSTGVMQAEDFILLHGNGQTPATITSMVNTVRSFGLNKPIVFNEDSTSTANFTAATNARASWGYFDAGLNNYVDGFQSPPTNWNINTPSKRNFFALLQSLTTSMPGRNKNPTATIHASSSMVGRGSDVLFTVSISAANPSQLTTVQYLTGGTAQLGTDYSLTGIAGEVDIPAGASSATVDLHALPRTGASGNLRVILTLGAGSGYRTGKPKKAVVTIRGGP